MVNSDSTNHRKKKKKKRQNADPRAAASWAWQWPDRSRWHTWQKYSLRISVSLVVSRVGGYGSWSLRRAYRISARKQNCLAVRERVTWLKKTPRSDDRKIELAIIGWLTDQLAGNACSFRRAIAHCCIYRLVRQYWTFARYTNAHREKRESIPRANRSDTLTNDRSSLSINSIMAAQD